MEAIIAVLLSVVNTIVKELTGKVWEQFKLEDTVNETEGVLKKLEVLDDADLNADLLGDVNLLPYADGDSFSQGDALV